MDARERERQEIIANAQASKKPKKRSIACLDMMSDDDHASDADFVGSGSDFDEDEEEDASASDSDVASRRRKGSSGPVRILPFFVEGDSHATVFRCADQTELGSRGMTNSSLTILMGLMTALQKRRRKRQRQAEERAGWDLITQTVRIQRVPTLIGERKRRNEEHPGILLVGSILQLNKLSRQTPSSSKEKEKRRQEEKQVEGSSEKTSTTYT